MQAGSSSSSSSSSKHGTRFYFYPSYSMPSSRTCVPGDAVEVGPVVGGKGLKVGQRPGLLKGVRVQRQRHRRAEHAGAAAGGLLRAARVGRGVGAEKKLGAAARGGREDGGAVLLAFQDGQAEGVRPQPALRVGGGWGGGQACVSELCWRSILMITNNWSCQKRPRGRCERGRRRPSSPQPPAATATQPPTLNHSKPLIKPLTSNPPPPPLPGRGRSGS